MKLPPLLKNLLGSKAKDEKHLSIEMSDRKTVNQSQTSISKSSSYYPMTAKVCYILSGVVGTIGTYFTLKSQTSDDTDMSSRVLYSLMLMSAGLLLEAAREAEKVGELNTITVPLPDFVKTIKIQDDKENNAFEEERLEEKHNDIITLDLKQQDANELLSSPPGSPSQTNQSSPLDELTTPIKENVPGMTVVQPASSDLAKQTQPWRLFTTGIDLFSFSWFGQAFSLFVRNAIVESSSSHLLPYTTLIGLSAGHLLHVCIKPWKLGGVRDWIVINRNVLVGIEFVVFFGLPQVIGQDLSFYYYGTSAFWSGFNLNEGTFFITKKLFGKKSSNKKSENDLINQKHHLDISSYSLRSSLTTAISGGILTSTAILSLEFIAGDTELRNIFVKFLSAMGCYLLTYPLGVYMGQKIPLHYHNQVLEVCTYLLIPLASPDLSILHLLAMMGSGMCGGVAKRLIDGQYQKKLAMADERLKEIEKLIKESPIIVQQLLELSLPEDQFLVNTIKKNREFKLPVRLLYVCTWISSFATQSLWKNYTVVPSLIVSLLLLSITNDFILPKYRPSVYDIHEISWVPRLFYSDSFNYAYISKVLVFIGLQGVYGVNGDFLLIQKIIPSSAILCANLGYIAFILTSIKAGKKFYGGYVPYVPSEQEIKQLELIAQPKKLEKFFKSNLDDKSISLNYHLLRFMKKNVKRTVDDNKNNDSSHSELAEQKTTPRNACSHPLNRLSLFAISNHSSVNADRKNESLSFPLATVRCNNCVQDITQINSEFSERSKKYTENLFNVSFWANASDSNFRGSALARQFTFNLPSVLSLTKDVKNFSI